MSERHLYSLYGHKVSLPFRCGQLAELSWTGTPDLMVAEGAVPRSLANPTSQGENWQAAPGSYLLKGGRRAGRFLVESGGRVILERNPDGEDDLLAAHFLSHVLAALMRSLGQVVLHASTVAVADRGVVLAGASGAGKSTTQGVLLSRGGTMVSDDVTVVQRGADERVEALPGMAKLNLCQDAATALGQDVNSLPRNPLRKIKVVAPHRGAMAEKPVPLHRLFLLEPAPTDQVVLIPLTGGEKFAALQSCVYGPMHPGEHPERFLLFAALSQQLQVFRLQRPRSSWSLDEVAGRILHG